MIRKSFVHRLSLILILDRISIEMCSVFDRFCTMKFSRFLLSHSKQLIHYSASVGSCQALFSNFFKKFSVPTSVSHAMKGLEPARCASEKRLLFGDDKIQLYSCCRHLSTTFSNFFRKVSCKSHFTELNAKCRSIHLGISLDLHILGVLMNDVILLLPS